MAFEFRLPDLGEGIEEAELLAWKVKPGDAVAAFQALCEVESAKAAVELTSPVAGRVRETLLGAGETARRGDVLVLIETEPEAQAAGEPEWFGIVGSAPNVAGPAPDGAKLTADSSKLTADSSKLTADSPKLTADGQEPTADRAHRVFAAPFVRKLARDRGIRLEDVQGSGPHGRVRLADIEAHATPAPATPDAPTTRVPLAGLRRRIAEHMLESMQHAPQVTTMDLFDVTELVRARRALQSSAAEAGLARLSYLPFFVKASIAALQAVPEANAVLDEPGQAIVLHHAYHIGIATAVPTGLVVPVIKHADRLNLIELGAEIERLVSAARERRSAPTDLTGSTFTITSFGGLPGSPLYGTPILNYPEVAILGIGRIDLQPRVVEGQIVARDCAGMSFTFDHRVLDGESAGRFMSALKRCLEQPLELLLRLR